MTSAVLAALVARYQAGLDTEIALLRQLQALATRERDACLAGQTDLLPALHDAREQVAASLVTFEHELRPRRQAVLAVRTRLEGQADFRLVVEAHHEAARLVAAIVAVDRESLAALVRADEARSVAARAIDTGEQTLTAYRRVIAPALASAALFTRQG